MSTVGASPPDRFLIRCLRCDRNVAARGDWIGKEVRCPHCASVLVVPPQSPDGRIATARGPGLGPKRYFNFPCGRCDSLLEAHTGMCGAEARCPTCGVRFTVPHLDARSGLPYAVQFEDDGENPTPVHAYAASGGHAPRIMRSESGPDRIECPRCSAQSPIDADQCVQCGSPFSIDAVPTSRGAQTSSQAIAAFVLGLTGLPAVFVPFLLMPALLAVILGGQALAEQRHIGVKTPAIAGVLLGVAGLAGGVIGLSYL